jgi:hypothetical protein
VPNLSIETRADGSLVLTDRGSGRWGLAGAGLAAGLLALAGVVAGDVTPLGAAVALPLGVIAVLTGIAAARHRDWMVFDRGARQIVFRRGLAAIFRPVSAVPFEEVEAVLVQTPETPGAAVEVALRRADDGVWLIDATPDQARAGRLAAALAAVGGWPVVREREVGLGPGG